jgi:protein ImuB
VRIGTPITTAKALAPNLIIGDSDPAPDTEGLNELALRALQRIFPVVMGERPDQLVIDTTGTDQLHGDDSAPLRATKRLEPQ